MIEVRNLAFTYSDRKVLRDVSFVVSPGETVSIVGANGAGKTTLMKLMAMLAVPDSGSILVDGQDVRYRPLRYLHQISYLPEKVALYDDMTVKEFLRYRARIKGEGARRIRRRLSEAVELCRIEDILRTPIGRLSSGQQKRVALADVLLLRPRVLLLDDLVAGLDHEMRKAIGDILSTAAAFSCVIVTGHDLEDMAHWTTRFLVLSDGSVSATVETAGLDPAVLRERLDALIGGGK